MPELTPRQMEQRAQRFAQAQEEQAREQLEARKRFDARVSVVRGSLTGKNLGELVDGMIKIALDTRLATEPVHTVASSRIPNYSEERAQYVARR